MATYKVIQDVEAEDKLIGPLTLKQFVYAGIAGLCIYLCYFVASKGAAFLIFFLVPPALVSAFFAFPWSREQPTELWALARISFLFKPRRRIWDQSGMKHLVTITAPKKSEQSHSDGLTQSEVKNRLHALASTIDSRGWAVKGSYASAPADNSDRLIGVNNLPQEMPESTETYPDMFDPSSNHMAQNFDSMLNSSAQQHRQQLVDAMSKSDAPQTSNTQAATAQQPQQQQQQQTQQAQPDYWFMNQNPAGSQQNQVVTPGATDSQYAQPANVSSEEEAALVEELKSHDTGPAREYSHLPTILPLNEQERLAKEQAAAQASQPQATAGAAAPQQPQQTADATNDSAAQAAPGQQSQQQTQQQPTMTDEPDAAILELAHNNDLNVETIARQANKAHGDNDEVVISLH